MARIVDQIARRGGLVNTLIRDGQAHGQVASSDISTIVSQLFKADIEDLERAANADARTLAQGGFDTRLQKALYSATGNMSTAEQDALNDWLRKVKAQENGEVGNRRTNGPRGTGGRGMSRTARTSTSSKSTVARKTRPAAGRTVQGKKKVARKRR